MTDSTYTTVAVHSNADMVNAVRVVIALAAEHVLLQALARALDLQYSSFQFVFSIRGHRLRCVCDVWSQLVARGRFR